MIRRSPWTVGDLEMLVGVLLSARDKSNEASADTNSADVRDSSIGDPDTAINDDGAAPTPGFCQRSASLGTPSGLVAGPFPLS